jgi:hypothetical protein
LSDFHNHHSQNPFQQLTEAEQQNVLSHMRNYHGGPLHDNPTMEEFSHYLPRIFEKIADNLKCYIESWNVEKRHARDANPAFRKKRATSSFYVEWLYLGSHLPLT